MSVTRYADDFGHRSGSLGDAVASTIDPPRQARDVRNGTGHRGADPDQWYYDLISQYQYEPWYNELLENPWLRSKNDPYTPNALNDIAGFFGFSDGSEEHYAKMKNNASQWLSDKLAGKHQEDHNSPIEQAKREAAAGVNVGAIPSSIDPGKAAENDQPVVPFPSFSEYDSGLQSLASLFTSIYSFASGIAKDSMSMKSINADLAGKEFDLASKMPSFVTDFITSHVGTPYKDKSGKWTFDDISDRDIADFARSHFSSRRTRRSFYNEVKSSFKSAKGFITRYGAFKSAEDVANEFAKSLGRNLAYGRGDKVGDLSPMVILTQTLTKTQHDLEKLNLEYQKDLTEFKKNKTAYESKVLEKLNPDAEAGFKNSGATSGSMQNWANYYEAKANKIVNKNLSDAADKLHKAVEKGGDSAGAQAVEFGIRMITSDNARKSLLDKIKYKDKTTTRDSQGRYVVKRTKRFGF